MDSSLPFFFRHYHVLLLVSPLDDIQFLRRAEKCKILLVGQYWFAHV